mmetsp:Transcript_34583/g.79062  ORF Transcript_34583/g.79062 Transcript_34583/m.79062 type:complete len:239 (-) Transcript_34583:3051-3767(-)
MASWSVAFVPQANIRSLRTASVRCVVWEAMPRSRVRQVVTHAQLVVLRMLWAARSVSSARLVTLPALLGKRCVTLAVQEISNPTRQRRIDACLAMLASLLCRQEAPNVRTVPLALPSFLALTVQASVGALLDSSCFSLRSRSHDVWIATSIWSRVRQGAHVQPTSWQGTPCPLTVRMCTAAHLKRPVPKAHSAHAAREVLVPVAPIVRMESTFGTGRGALSVVLARVFLLCQRRFSLS